jgi:hypothetical protein
MRVLMDRIWPRGVSKGRAALSLWLKDIAPSSALRIWFDHDPGRLREFRQKYLAELDQNEASVNGCSTRQQSVASRFFMRHMTSPAAIPTPVWGRGRDNFRDKMGTVRLRVSQSLSYT